MEKGTFSSENIVDFLREIKSKYKTGGVWISRKLGKRWSFLVGVEPEGTSPPCFLEINGDFALFCEDGELLKRDWDSVKRKLQEMLYADRT